MMSECAVNDYCYVEWIMSGVVSVSEGVLLLCYYASCLLDCFGGELLS